MKALKRSLFAFLCLTAAAAFVGCGSSDDNTNNGNVNNEQANDSNETEMPADDTAKPEATDQADDGGNIGEDIVDTVDDVGTGIVDGVTDVGDDIVDGVGGNSNGNNNNANNNNVNDATNGTVSPAPTQTP